MEQGAASPLDDIEIGGDLVGAVDAEVDPTDLVQRPQGDASERARSDVRFEVATPVKRMPSTATRRPSASTTASAVDPEPNPTTIPGRTSAAASVASSERRLRSSI